MSYENVELMFSDADCLPDLFRKSRKGSIYLTPYRVGMMKEGKSFGADFSDQLAARNKSCFFSDAVLEPKQTPVGVGDHNIPVDQLHYCICFMSKA